MSRLCVDKQTLIPAATKKCVDNLPDWVHSGKDAICLWKTEGKCINSGEIPIKPVIRGIVAAYFWAITSPATRRDKEGLACPIEQPGLQTEMHDNVLLF
jgi:hypothetical protein